VEPVEINSGAWYLRAPRQDDLIDDRPALALLGEMLAEVALDPATAVVRTRARDGYADAASVAEQSVRRFAAAALLITISD
jgi:hypothetical protein